ncbi:MAG: TIGR04255 family protein [Myxococcales bacterium]|nr:TIGR04255 family protein [Myxococcales bacterium]
MTEMPMLNLPSVERVQFERNFIRTAACELRFPALLKLDSDPPIKIQQALRKEYPIYEIGASLDIGPAGVDRSKIHRFVSKRKDWIVGLSSHSIVLVTTNYQNFEKFRERLQFLIDRAVPELDTDFFTRVGLRYVNQIPIPESTDWSELGELINRDLIAPLIDGVYGLIGPSENTVRGRTEVGGYSFRHGMKPNPDKSTCYELDFDWYTENVSVDDTIELVSIFNEKNFQFFHWCLGHEAIESLGKPSPKNEER